MITKFKNIFEGLIINQFEGQNSFIIDSTKISKEELVNKLINGLNLNNSGNTFYLENFYLRLGVSSFKKFNNHYSIDISILN